MIYAYALGTDNAHILITVLYQAFACEGHFVHNVHNKVMIDEESQ